MHSRCQTTIPHNLPEEVPHTDYYRLFIRKLQVIVFEH
nr:MAG TPA: hypothetical protein [Caudoviricetes sp.]